MSAHTKGPWSARDVRYNRDFRTCVNVMTEDGLRFVAAVSCDPSSDRQQLEANARLVSASPTLLAALQSLVGGKCPECKGWGEVAHFGEMVSCRCNGKYRHVPTDDQIAAARAAISLAGEGSPNQRDTKE